MRRIKPSGHVEARGGGLARIQQHKHILTFLSGDESMGSSITESTNYEGEARVWQYLARKMGESVPCVHGTQGRGSVGEVCR